MYVYIYIYIYIYIIYTCIAIIMNGLSLQKRVTWLSYDITNVYFDSVDGEMEKKGFLSIVL